MCDGDVARSILFNGSSDCGSDDCLDGAASTKGSNRRATGLVSRVAPKGPPSVVVTGVFDGHGGESAARYAQESLMSYVANDWRLHASLVAGDAAGTSEALKAAFRKVDRELLALAARPPSAPPSRSPSPPPSRAGAGSAPAPAAAASPSGSPSPSGLTPGSASVAAAAAVSHTATPLPAQQPTADPHRSAAWSGAGCNGNGNGNGVANGNGNGNGRHVAAAWQAASPPPSPFTTSAAAAASPPPPSPAAAAFPPPPGSYRDGTTALLAVQCGGLLAVANVGDSRAVLCRGGQAVRLSRDHTPALRAERERIEAAGGQVVVARGAARVVVPLGGSREVMQALSVSRSLGDPDFKVNGLVIGEPDVTLLPLQPPPAAVRWGPTAAVAAGGSMWAAAEAEADPPEAPDGGGGGDWFLIVASDGLWGRVGDQEAVDCVAGVLREYARMSRSPAPSAPARAAARALLRLALDAGSMDDVTVVVCVFEWGRAGGVQGPA